MLLKRGLQLSQNGDTRDKEELRGPSAPPLQTPRAPSTHTLPRTVPPSISHPPPLPSPPHVPLPWPPCLRHCPAAGGRTLNGHSKPPCGEECSHSAEGGEMGGVQGQQGCQRVWWERGGIGSGHAGQHITVTAGRRIFCGPPQKTQLECMQKRGLQLSREGSKGTETQGQGRSDEAPPCILRTLRAPSTHPLPRTIFLASRSAPLSSSRRTVSK